MTPGCDDSCARQFGPHYPLQKQARQDSNLQPPVLERTPSNAGVATFIDSQRLSSEPPTPASLDNAGVDTNPGTEEDPACSQAGRIALPRWPARSAAPSPCASGYCSRSLSAVRSMRVIVGGAIAQCALGSKCVEFR